jgi:hypothetical protein
MPNQIKELALPVSLVVLLLGYPAIVVADVVADTINPTPFTAVYSAGEWVVNKISAKPKPSFHSPERQARFDSWMKEDWLKDDPYACMWDRNWIRKYKQDVCL